MDTINVVLISMTIGIGIFSAIQLFTPKSAGRNHNFGLGLFILCVVISSFDSLLNVTGIYDGHPHLAGILWPIGLFYGPTVYLYVVMMTSREPLHLSRDLLLKTFWPSLIAVIACLPFYWLDGAEKLAVYSGSMADLNGESLSLGGAFMSTHSILFVGTNLFYLVLAIRILFRHVKTLRNLFSNIEDKSLNWLRYINSVLALSLCWAVIGASLDNYGMRTEWDESLSLLLELSWVCLFGFFGNRQKPIYEDVLSVATDAQSEHLDVVTKGLHHKYSRSALDKVRMERIAEKLSKVFEEEKLHRNANISLGSLAAKLNVTENYLSQTLNDYIGQNFFDFVNRYRIEDAKERLSDPEISIVRLAEEVGFNSRSTFNAAFKKFTGSTPSTYRREIRIHSNANVKDTA